MRIRLLASPPLFISADGVDYAVDVSFRSGGGLVEVHPRNRPEATVCLGKVEHEGEDVRLAWREGIEVASSDQAIRHAKLLVKLGLAQQIHASSSAVTHEPRGGPH